MRGLLATGCVAMASVAAAQATVRPDLPWRALEAPHVRVLFEPGLEALARRVDDWNSTKHITTSEKVDAPRDQTTDGISLLDDFRRYIMSGQHTGISSNYMMMSGPEGVAPREDPSNVANSWINDFSFAGEKLLGLQHTQE